MNQLSTLPVFFRFCLLLLAFGLLPQSSFAQQGSATSSVQPAEVITAELQAVLPLKAPTQIPFTAYQIKVSEKHSSLVIQLSGEAGDADLLLVADKPMEKPADALFTSVSPTSNERLELRRNTVPALRNTDYFLYVFHSSGDGEEQGNLDLRIDLNFPADDGLEQLPSLPEGVISHEGEQEPSAWLMTFTQSAQVNLALPTGSAPGKTLVRLQVPEDTRSLSIDLWGNISDIDLYLQGPQVEGQERIERASEQENSREQILLSSAQEQTALPSGDWLLTLERRDQAQSEPLLLRVDMR